MKATQRFAISIFLFLAAILRLHAETVASMPAPAGYIDDYAQVLSSDAVSNMETIARELHNKTRAQIFLVTINTLEGEPVESFANELFAKWKIGEKKTDRGVLMLFAIKDRKRWIEIGYGLEPILNDAKVGDIGREMVPSLRQRNYDEATRLGLSKICLIIATDSNVTLESLSSSSPVEPPVETQQTIKSSPEWFGFLFPLFWFGIIIFIIIRGIASRRRRGIGPGGYVGPGTSWSDGGSGGNSSFGGGDDGGFSGGDGGSSGGGGAGGDW